MNNVVPVAIYSVSGQGSRPSNRSQERARRARECGEIDDYCAWMRLGSNGVTG